MPVNVILTIDVEEEGLFSGKYSKNIQGVRNIAWLKELDPIIRKGVKPTLFCAHSVFADKNAWPVLERFRDQHGAEIAAHLHYWNTPPLQDGPDVLSSVPSCDLEPSIFAEKLASLLKAGEKFQGSPITSFRMGRWDLHKWQWPYLFEAGIKTDSSIRPLFAATTPKKGGNHFDAPFKPYWINHGKERILEAPLTVVPLSSLLAKLHMAPQNEFGKKARFFMRYWNTLSLLPVYYPLWMLKLATRIALSKSDVLVITWHSSEMMPGGAPHLPDAPSIQHMLRKAVAWIEWLQKKWNANFITLSELRALLENINTGEISPGKGDWRP